jgi:AraC-like DNA-binding protein
MNALALVNLVSAAMGFFVAFIILSQIRKRNANLWLGLFVMSIALLAAETAFFCSDLIFLHPNLSGWFSCLMLALGPLLYFYLRAFTGEPIPLRWGWIHFLPVIILLAVSWPYFHLPKEAKLLLIQQLRTHPPKWSGTTALTAVQLLGYLVACYWYLSQLSEKLQAVSSNLDRTSFLWLRRLIVLVICVYLGWVPNVALGHYWLMMVHSITIPLAIYLMAAVALRTPDVFVSARPLSATLSMEEDQATAQDASGPIAMLSPALSPAEEDAAVEAKYQKSRLPDNLLARYEARLRDGMEAQRFFLDRELSLASLAKQLGISPHHLSQVLNDRIGIRFSEYVNGLRVEEAKRLLADPGHAQLSVFDLALRAGFSSKTTFNTFFKRSTGFTPNGWRNNLLQRKTA